MCLVLWQTLWTCLMWTELFCLPSATSGSLVFCFSWNIKKKKIICPGCGISSDEACDPVFLHWQRHQVPSKGLCSGQILTLVWYFHSCSQQGDQTEEWGADSWRKKKKNQTSGNLLIYFFHSERKKKKGSTSWQTVILHTVFKNCVWK